MITTIRDFYQHINGKIYAIESDTFGTVLGASGPLDASDLHNLREYHYKAAIAEWVTYAIDHKKLHRYVKS
jgi:hypothetical protein